MSCMCGYFIYQFGNRITTRCKKIYRAVISNIAFLNTFLGAHAFGCIDCKHLGVQLDLNIKTAVGYFLSDKCKTIVF